MKSLRLLFFSINLAPALFTLIILTGKFHNLISLGVI
jgi:hypothetical protein